MPIYRELPDGTRVRDYRAENARRNDKAREQGYRSGAERRAARAKGATRPEDTTAAPQRRRVIPTPAGTIVRVDTVKRTGAKTLLRRLLSVDPATPVTISGSIDTSGGVRNFSADTTAGDIIDKAADSGIFDGDDESEWDWEALDDLYGDLDDYVSDAAAERYGGGGSGNAWSGATVGNVQVLVR